MDAATPERFLLTIGYGYIILSPMREEGVENDMRNSENEDRWRDKPALRAILAMQDLQPFYGERDTKISTESSQDSAN